MHPRHRRPRRRPRRARRIDDHPMPEVPAPDELGPRGGRRRRCRSGTASDIRPASGRAVRALADEARHRRLDPPRPTTSPLDDVVLADALPTPGRRPCSHRLELPVGVPTIDLTVHFRQAPPRTCPTGRSCGSAPRWSPTATSRRTARCGRATGACWPRAASSPSRSALLGRPRGSTTGEALWPGTSRPSRSSRRSSSGCATFVREEIEPLETLDLDYDTLRRVTDPLKEQVQAQGLWAAHLPPELGGGGFGQVKLGLMHEILGRCIYAPSVFGNNAPDSGNSELIVRGRHRGAEGAVDAPAARRQAPLRLLDDRARRRRRPHAARHHRGARRRRVGDQRPQVVHVQRVDRRLPHRDGGDQPGRAPVPGQLDVHRPRRHPRGGDRARRADDGRAAPRHRPVRRPRRDPLQGRAHPVREHRRRRGRHRPGLRARPEAARPRPDPPRDALARPGPAGVRHAVRAVAVALHARLHAGREADGAGLDRHLGHRDAGRPAPHAARRVEDGPGRRVASPASRSR